MINLEIPYALHRSAIVKFPSEWNELTKAELLHYCKPTEQEKKADVVRADMLLFLLEERRDVLPKGWTRKLDPEDTVLQCFPLLDFLFDRNTLTTQLVTDIPLGGKKYLGPKSDFDDMTVGEYEEAALCRKMYRETDEAKWLHQLTSVLYREKGKEGKRLPYHPNEEPNEALFSELDPAILGAIYVWFVGCENAVVQQFPRIFNGRFGGVDDIMAFTKTIHAGAGPKNGTREQVRALPLKEFFFDLECNAEQVEEMERKLKMNN